MYAITVLLHNIFLQSFGDLNESTEVKAFRKHQALFNSDIYSINVDSGGLL